MSERNPDSAQLTKLRLTEDLRGDIERLLPDAEDERLVLALLGTQHLLRAQHQPYQDVAVALRRVPDKFFAFARRARG